MQQADGLPLQQSDEYAIQKCCMSVEAVAPLSDNPAIELPAGAPLRQGCYTTSLGAIAARCLP